MAYIDLLSPRDFFEKFLKDFSALKIPWNNQGIRSQRLLSHLGKLGEKHGYEVWVGNWNVDRSIWQGKKERYSEYLVDLCWYVVGDQYYWMELAVEQEWKPEWERDIWPEFSKLLDVKANLKVLLCSPHEAERREVPRHVATSVSLHRFKTSDEAYLILIFSLNPKLKPAERLLIEGFAIDYRGALTPLGSQHFPDAPPE